MTAFILLRMIEVCEKNLFLVSSAEVYGRGTNVAMTVARLVQNFNAVNNLNADVENGCLIHIFWLTENQFAQTRAQTRCYNY